MGNRHDRFETLVESVKGNTDEIVVHSYGHGEPLPEPGVLYNAFCQNTKMKNLDLDAHHQRLYWLSEVFSALLVNRTLVALALRNTVVTQDQFAFLCHVLKQKPPLRKLTLECNGIGPVRRELLVDALKVNRLLTSLDVANNVLGDDGCVLLFDALDTIQSLRHLSLINVQMTDIGLIHAAMAVAKPSVVLTHLFLDNNGYTAAGVSKFASSLKKNTTIRKLRIPSCGLDDTCFVHFGDLLKTNTTLSRLHLGSNWVNGPGIVAIADGLAQNNALTSLKLDNIKLEDAGLEALFRLLKENKHLLKVNFGLYDKNIPNQEDAGTIKKLPPTLIDTMEAALQINKSVKYLMVQMSLAADDMERLIAAIRLSNFSLLRVDFNYMEQFQNSINDLMERNIEHRKKLCLSALKGNSSAPWQRSKIMIVGEGRAGKSATAASLLGRHFNPVWDSTIGVQTIETHVRGNGDDWEVAEETLFAPSVVARAVLALMESNAHLEEGLGLSEEERYKFEHRAELEAIRQEQEMEAVVRALREDQVFEDPMAQNPNAINRNNDDDEMQLDEDQEAPLALAEELRGREEVILDQEEVEELWQEFPQELLDDDQVAVLLDDPREEEEDVDPVEVVYGGHMDYDALEEERLSVRASIWDFGGQKVFHTLHHIFMTSLGAYIFVFNICDALESIQELLINLRFWLQSIRIHSPEAPVILVATCIDLVEGAKHLRDVSREIAKEFNDHGQIVRPPGSLIFHPISNKEGTGVDELRITLEHVVWEQDYVHSPVSIAWMRALDDLLSGSEESSIVSRVYFKEKAAALEVGSDKEVTEMLNLFHAHGVVLYFNMSETLRKQIIIKPQWLIEQFGQLIRDRDVHQYGNEVEVAGVKEDAYKFLEFGLATRDFLDFLWGSKHSTYLLDLMHRLLLLSPWSEEETYLVPCMVLTAPPRAEITGHKFRFQFEYLPDGVFERVVCLCVSFADSSNEVPKETQPMLYQDNAIIYLRGDCKAHLRRTMTSIDVVVAESPALAVRICERMLKRVAEDVMHSRLKWKVIVDNNGKDTEFAVAKKKKIAPWYEGNVDVQSVTNYEAFMNSTFM